MIHQAQETQGTRCQVKEDVQEVSRKESTHTLPTISVHSVGERERERASTVGCFTELDREETGTVTTKWKCPDPGCKTKNQRDHNNCTNCNLPRHTTHHFGRSQSKILKQL